MKLISLTNADPSFLLDKSRKSWNVFAKTSTHYIASRNGQVIKVPHLERWDFDPAQYA